MSVNKIRDMPTETKQEKEDTQLRNITDSQRKVMIEFLKAHSVLKSVRFTSTFTKKDAQTLWQELSGILNVMLGPKKFWGKWRKSYQDWKGKVKNIVALESRSRGATGGGPPVQIVKDPNDQSMSEMIDPVLVQGLPGIPEFQVKFNFPEKTTEQKNLKVISVEINENSDEQKTDATEVVFINEIDEEQKVDAPKRGMAKPIPKFQLLPGDTYIETEFSTAIYSIDDGDVEVKEITRAQSSNRDIPAEVETTDDKKPVDGSLYYVNKENDKSDLNGCKLEIKARPSRGNQDLKGCSRLRTPANKLNSVVQASGVALILSGDVAVKANYYKRKLDLMENVARSVDHKARALERIANVMETM